LGIGVDSGEKQCRDRQKEEKKEDNGASYATGETCFDVS
jgi:hypothetical protein